MKIISPGLKDDDGNMEEETNVVTTLRKQFQDITFEEEEPGSDAISINGIEIKGSDYNTEKIMDVIYEELNKSKAKEPKKEIPEVLKEAKEISIDDI